MISKAKILIVEDDPEMAENLAEVMQGAGHETETVPNAERALELLRAGSFEGVITDFKLPGRNGVDLIADLRRAGIPLPVVIVSAFMDHAVVDRAEAAGALDVLPKPVELDRLFALVAEFARTGGRVLIVEDDEAFAENVAEALRERGLQAIVGLSGAQALAERKLPEVALLDLELPDQSGIAVANRLSARNPKLRLMFVTGHGEEIRARLGPLSDTLPGLDPDEPYLTKPVDLERLIEWVRAAAQR